MARRRFGRGSGKRAEGWRASAFWKHASSPSGDPLVDTDLDVSLDASLDAGLDAELDSGLDASPIVEPADHASDRRHTQGREAAEAAVEVTFDAATL